MKFFGLYFDYNLTLKLTLKYIFLNQVMVMKACYSNGQSEIGEIYIQIKQLRYIFHVACVMGFKHKCTQI